MRMTLHRLNGSQRLDSAAQPRHGSGHQIAGRPEDASQADDVPETTDDNIAVANVGQDLFVAQGQQVGVHHREVRISDNACGDLLRGTHDSADADAAAQELLENPAAGTPGAAH